MTTQGFAQELQAEINQELLLPLHERELDDWNRFGKVRQAWEKWLRDPNDVLIEAEDPRQELREQKKKPLREQEKKPRRRQRKRAGR